MINGFIVRSANPNPSQGAAQAVVRSARRALSPSAMRNARNPLRQNDPDEERWRDFLEVAGLVLGRWVPGIGWGLLAYDLFSFLKGRRSAVQQTGWVTNCRVGGGDPIGNNYNCSPPAGPGAVSKSYYNQWVGRPRFIADRWYLSEIERTGGDASNYTFLGKARMWHFAPANSPPTYQPYYAPVPDLGYGPDPGYWFPTWIDPGFIPPTVPAPEPSPPPYEAVPHRQPNPDRVEQTERGYHVHGKSTRHDFRSQYYANPALNPWGSHVVAPANGMQGMSYVAQVLGGRVSRTSVVSPSVEPNIYPRPGGEVDPVHPPDSAGPRDPGTREKERKHKLSIGGSPATLVGAFTESLDFLDVLYRSLPSKYNRTKKCKPKKLGVAKKAKLVWDHANEIDLEKFVVNFTNNQIQDAVFGGFGRLAARGAHKAGLGHGMQFGTSQNRKQLGDIDSDIAKKAKSNDEVSATECRRLKGA